MTLAQQPAGPPQAQHGGLQCLLNSQCWGRSQQGKRGPLHPAQCHVQRSPGSELSRTRDHAETWPSTRQATGFLTKTKLPPADPANPEGENKGQEVGSREEPAERQGFLLQKWGQNHKQAGHWQACLRPDDPQS